MNIGILALQGAFIEHEKLLDKLGVEYTELRRKLTLIQSLTELSFPVAKDCPGQTFKRT